MEKDSGFEEFYKNGFPAVFKAALVMAGDRNLAEDATQEAFARALERWSSMAEQPLGSRMGHDHGVEPRSAGSSEED